MTTKIEYNLKNTLKNKVLLSLYKKMLNEIPNIKLIASGGISTFDELPKLAEIGCEGTIIGKAIYENRISMKQLEDYIIKS